MLGLRTAVRRKSRYDAEKPFWISFSDLMTAMMVLFLVAMAAALLASTQGIARLEAANQGIARMEAAKKQHDETIRSCIVDIGALTERPGFHGVVVKNDVIEFGTLAEFERNQNTLNHRQQSFLRAFVPRVLDVARHPNCEKWLKRIVVEGFASQEGSYLYNLNLSFTRSQRVLCVLLDPRPDDALGVEDRKLIRSLFLAGGSSFNARKQRPEESRRVELKLEFREPGQDRELPPDIPWDEDTKCPSDEA